MIAALQTISTFLVNAWLMPQEDEAITLPRRDVYPTTPIMRTLVTTVLLSVLLSSCGSGSTRGGEHAPAALDLTGVWRFTEEIASAQGDCEPDLVGQKRSATFKIDSVGPDSIIITNLTKPETSPTEVRLEGDQATWAWFETVGAIIAEEEGQGTFSQDAFTATTIWSETDVSRNITCSGTSNLVGVRLHPAPSDNSEEEPSSPGAAGPIKRF